MMNAKWRKLMLALTVVVVAGLGVFTISLERNKASLASQLVREKTRLEQFQRKYGECKRVSESLLAVKTGMEGRQRAVQAEAETALQTLKAENADFQARLKGSAQGLSAITAERDRLNRVIAEMQEAEKKTGRELKACSETNDALEKVKKGTDEKFRKTENELNRARTKNGELCTIALELVDRYKKKGILGAVADKEPLTQINRAKLEADIQEYRDKIEGQRISPSGK